ncbi:MAG: aryl-sulfate sulfotransferase [Pseudomonadota bacterium]|nr:aryl-sulfate sulfotransferase [Pseudomonadota bacterium]
MLLLLLACVAPPSETDFSGVEGPTVEATDMPTVARVRWTTETPTRGTVTGRFGDDAVVVSEAAEGTEHEVLLAGLPARTDVAVEVQLDGVDLGAAAGFTTGSLPTWVPDVTVSADVPEDAEGGYTIVALIALEAAGVVVFDADGRPVWAYARADENDAALTRARLSLDGRALVYSATAHSVDDPGYIVRLPLDGGAATMVSLNGLHTDFVELPTGGYAALGWELHTLADGRTIVSDTIMELGPDGTQRTVWRVFDDFQPDPADPFENQYPGDPDIRDWSHVNSLTYDAAADDYYVTMTWNSGVARIDRETGALAWSLSDEGGDFTNTGEGRLAFKPHTVEPTANGLLVFSRGDPREPDSCSEATDLVVDEALGTVHRGMAYTSERCLLITFLGSAQRLPGGNTLVGWTSAGQLDEFTPDGNLALRIATNIGAGFGFATRVPTLGAGAP